MTAVRRWGLVSALGTVGLFAGRAQAAPRVPTHVACVGDSITAGFDASSPAKSYPSDLQGLFGASVHVNNFGHSGATMLSAGFGDLPYEDQPEYAGATSFVTSAGAAAVVDVVIMLGTNDSKPINWTPAGKPKNDQQYLKDYRAMVEHFLALKPKPEVFLALPLATGTTPCCTISGTVIHDEIVPLIKQLAQEEQLPTIDLNTPTSNHDEYFVDGVHPNDAGYAIVAQIFHDGLLQDLAAGGGGTGGGAGASGSAGSAGASGNVGASGSAGASAGGASGVSGSGAGGAGVPGGGGSPSAAGATGVTFGGAGGAVFAGAGAAGSGVSGGAAASPTPENNSQSSGCSFSPAKRAGWAEPLLPTFLLLTLIGLRRRPVLHARPRS
jgi:acyl-CoA thioesterase-1